MALFPCAVQYTLVAYLFICSSLYLLIPYPFLAPPKDVVFFCLFFKSTYHLGLWLFYFILFIYLFIYLWLCWVFVSMWGLSLVAASGGHSSSRCADLSLSRPLLLRSTGSRRAGSAIVAHRPSRSAACGIFPRPGLEPVSPALAGRFSTTAPPGKPKDVFSKNFLKWFWFLTLFFCFVILNFIGLLWE